MKKKSTIEAYKGMSFSDASLKIKSKYPQADVDLIQKNSLKVELEQLMTYQEKKRVVSQMTEAVKQFKKGGLLPKYAPGGLLGDPTKPAVPLVEDPWNGVNPNLPFIENPFQGMINELPPTPALSPEYAPERLWQKPSMSVPNLQTRVVEPAKPLFGANPPTINNSLGMSTPKDKPVIPREMSAYTPALIGQGISTAINAGILSKGYDKVSPVDNPFESQVISNMADRNIDTTQQRNQILSAYNAAKQGINNSRSANVRNALDANMLNLTQDNLASSKLQEQQINQGYKGEFANVLNNLGQQKAQAQTYSEDATAKNKGNFQSNLSAFGKNIADNSQFFTAAKLNTVQNKLLSDILSNKYADVGLNPDIVTRMSEGKLTPDDITILKAKLPKDAVDGIIKSYNDIYGN